MQGAAGTRDFWWSWGAAGRECRPCSGSRPQGDQGDQPRRGRASRWVISSGGIAAFLLRLNGAQTFCPWPTRGRFSPARPRGARSWTRSGRPRRIPWSARSGSSGRAGVQGPRLPLAATTGLRCGRVPGGQPCRLGYGDRRYRRKAQRVHGRVHVDAAWDGSGEATSANVPRTPRTLGSTALSAIGQLAARCCRRRPPRAGMSGPA